MNVNPSIQCSQKNLLSSAKLQTPVFVAESAGHKVSQHSSEKNYLRKDIELFTEVAGCGIPNRNIMVSPLLISATEKITANLMDQAGLEGQTMSKEVTRPAIKNTAEGVHVLSKRPYVDTALESLQIPHTTSHELTQQGYDAATRQLNDRIAKDTNGMITDILSPETLENPDLAFQLITWLFEHVKWKEPFELMDKGLRSSQIEWNSQKQPKIDWMESAEDTNSIARTNIRGFDFIALPVQESGLKALFVMPPSLQPEEYSTDQMVNILAEGIDSMLGKPFDTEVKLFLPKYQFDYEFEKAYPEAQASGKHRAALDINEKGAAVAAASCMVVADCVCFPDDPELYINRPFYFAMVNQQNPSEPRIVGMAYVNQPWND